MPIGDPMSQMHDLLLHSNGLIYVGDNLQDRVYEIDPATGKYTVYKIPPQPGDKLGGLLAGRLHDFPKHETYQGIHSLAESPKDKHIFITPSYQRRLIEFDPVTKAFRVHQMDSGFYPHTIRFDAKDRVWFTLALSNQVAMFDRTSNKFTLYDLPFRSFMEKMTVKLTPFIFKLLAWGIPVANYVKVDHVSTGVPLPYGIDITPDGKGLGGPHAHRRNCLGGPRHGCGDHDQDALQGAAPATERPRRQPVDRGLQRIEDRPIHPEDRTVHAVRPARQPQGQRHTVRPQRRP
jgi:virginiamycin B lyase